MSLVKGFGEEFYDIPDDILAEYILSEEEVNRIKTEARKFRIPEYKNQDVTGYSTGFMDYEGFGYICCLC
jgi:hypothetical protein